MGEPETLLEGKYEILNKLREGGMGTLYRVRHRLLDEVRVIKVMRPHAVADADLRRRFFDEARMATRLKHPNICTILDFALDDEGTAYLVMEFIDGLNLSEFLGVRGSPGVPLALEIAHQALLALAYLHRKNIVHRDVAPDNLMLTKSEEDQPLVKLVDLGIAKFADRPTEMTATGVFLGKLRYASPEQFGSLPSGERVDGRSDLYSLGVVLYELLTETRPFQGDSPGEMLRSHLIAPPIPFAESDPQGRVPAEVREVILKALQKKREDRFASAEDFDREILALKQRLGQPEDLESSRKMLAGLPTVLRESGDHVTPSAQDRLNRQFVDTRTPHPSTTSQSLAPTMIPTADRGGSGGVPAGQKTKAIAGAPRKRATGKVVAVAAAAALAAGIVAGWLVMKPRQETPAAAALTRAAPSAVPQSKPRPAPSVEVEPTAPAPTPEPTVERPTVPPAAPAAAAASDAALAAAARRAADRARPRALPTSRPSIAAAIAPTAPARLEPTRKVPPTLVAQKAPEKAVEKAGEQPPDKEAGASNAAGPPASPSRASVSEQDRIRDTVHRYERAQSTLDAELYARVFPTVDRGRIERAFQSLASQTVQFEIRKIQIDASGAQAKVDGYETRTALPRAGTEQRVSGDRVLHLEKRGDGWVIVGLN